MDKHRIRVKWQLRAQLIDALGCLHQSGKMYLGIQVPELAIGDDGKPVSQGFRQCEIVLIHCCKVSPGHALVQPVS